MPEPYYQDEAEAAVAAYLDALGEQLPRDAVFAALVAHRSTMEDIKQGIHKGGTDDAVRKALAAFVAALRERSRASVTAIGNDLTARAEQLRHERAARCQRGYHEDPDNSGMCILCGFVWDRDGDRA